MHIFMDKYNQKCAESNIQKKWNMFTLNVYRSCMMILSNLFFAINWIESASGLVIHITT